jgi:hypothetical protein
MAPGGGDAPRAEVWGRHEPVRMRSMGGATEQRRANVGGVRICRNAGICRRMRWQQREAFGGVGLRLVGIVGDADGNDALERGRL